MMEKELLTIIDENGAEVLCEVLFSFDSTDFNKSYVIYYPFGVEEDAEGNLPLYAATFDPEVGMDGKLLPVTTEEEWDMIEELVATFLEEEEEEEVTDAERAMMNDDVDVEALLTPEAELEATPEEISAEEIAAELATLKAEFDEAVEQTIDEAPKSMTANEAVEQLKQLKAEFDELLSQAIENLLK
ncbi:MAG: DUF1292 domain-containing protein [Culicoidibacterales bacterium]